MANHMRESGAGGARNAKQASLLASAQSAQRRQRGDDAMDTVSRVQPDGASRSAANSSSRATSNDSSRRTDGGVRASARQSQASRREGARHGRPQQPGRESLGAFMRRNSVYIISVVAVVVIVVLMLVLVRGCVPEAQVGGGASPDQTANGASGDAAVYNWDCLDRTDGRYRYVVDGEVRSRVGIDVSENQHSIDWQAVADDGIEFAIIRLGYRGATEGDLYLDERFEQNLAGAKAAGIDCGVYFFSQAQSMEEAVAEADFVVEHLSGVQLEYPIAFDSEEAVLNVERSRTAGLSDTTMTAIAEAFCARVIQSGYQAIIYGNAADLSRYYYESMDSRDFWWAEYGVDHPSTDFALDMWQYSNSGAVAGIETEVDMNIDLSRV